MKEFENDTKNEKIFHVLGLEELILLKYTQYPKQSTDFMHPYQSTHDVFHRNSTNNPNIYMEPQKTELPKQS